MPDSASSSASTESPSSPAEDDSSSNTSGTQLSLDAPSFLERFWNVLQGRPKNFRDPGIFHKISLVAFLAWVGLGGDGLSSSAYGPDECFRALQERGDFTFLAVFLAIATAVTVMILSLSYSQIIEHFPSGGGGYVVATKLLGKTRRACFRECAARRLRADHFRVHRFRRRCGFQHVAAPMAPL